MRRFLEYASGSTVWENGLEDTYAADSDGGSAPLIDRDAEFTGAADYIISALEDKGYKCVKAVGKSGYKIDIGVVDKVNDGIYTAGIMIDGATYKNAKSTRDREVAQKSVLEGLGWRIMRVWSVDLWEDPEKVISRVIDFIEKNGLADAYVTVGCEGYVADPEDEIVIGFNGENLMLVDACYYEGFCD